MRSKYFKVQGNRIIKPNHIQVVLRENARLRLNSPKGIIKKDEQQIKNQYLVRLNRTKVLEGKCSEVN